MVVAKLFHIEIRPNTEERNIAMHDARAFAEDGSRPGTPMTSIASCRTTRPTFLSPLAQKRVGNGRVKGLAALRNYWSGAFGGGAARA